MPARGQARVRQDHGCSARAHGQGGELVAQHLCVAAVRAQARERGLDHGAAAFPVDDQAKLDLAALDQIAHQVHSIYEAQTSVGDVEVEASLR